MYAVCSSPETPKNVALDRYIYSLYIVLELLHKDLLSSINVGISLLALASKSFIASEASFLVCSMRGFSIYMFIYFRPYVVP